MKVTVDVDTKTFVRFWLVVLGFAAGIGAIFLARDALFTIGVALFLALALNPPVTWLASRLPGKSRIGATAIAYLIVVTLLGSIMFLVVPPIIEQTAKFTATVPSLIDKATSQRPVFDDFVKRYNLGGAIDEAIANAKSQAADISKQLGTMLVDFVTGAVGWLMRLFFILVLGFFMLVEGPMWVRRIWDLYEDADKLEAHRSTVDKMYRVVTGFVNGQITVAAIGGLSMFVTLLILSFIPNLQMPTNLALPLAVIIFVLELIPMIGAPLATVVTGLVILLNSPAAAAVFVVLYLLYQQLEANVIGPRIQSKNVELSVLWIIMALLIGSSVFGLIGGLVSIPIAGCARILLIDYVDYAKKCREKRSEPKGRLAKLIKNAVSDD